MRKFCGKARRFRSIFARRGAEYGEAAYAAAESDENRSGFQTELRPVFSRVQAKLVAVRCGGARESGQGAAGASAAAERKRGGVQCDALRRQTDGGHPARCAGAEKGGGTVTVWGDGVFLLNAALDYLLLAGAVRLRGGVLRQRRLLAAAMLGGAAALASLYLRAPWGVLGLPVLTVCAFGVSPEALRRGALFFCLSLALCGIQEVLARLLPTGTLLRRGGVLLLVSWRTLLASAGVLYGACALLHGAVCGQRRRVLPTQLTLGGRSVSFRSLVDTGSFLSDPLSGRAVLLADAAVARRLLDVSPEALRAPEELLERLARQQPELCPRLIPYRAVGTAQGLLLGVRCREMRVGAERRRNGIVAFSPEELSRDGSFHGLKGG